MERAIGLARCARLNARRRSVAPQGDRRDRRKAGSAGRIAWRAAPVPPAGTAAAVAERGSPHAHCVHHAQPAATGGRRKLYGLRRSRPAICPGPVTERYLSVTLLARSARILASRWGSRGISLNLSSLSGARGRLHGAVIGVGCIPGEVG